MKWKKDVIIEKKERYIIKNLIHTKHTKMEEQYIFDAVQSGITKDSELMKVIMKKEKIDEVIADLKLAQFIIDYGEFIDEVRDHMIIET